VSNLHPSDNTLQKNAVSDAEISVVPNQKYMIILTNGKEISTHFCREQDNLVFFYQNGGEVQIGKDKVSEIRKLN
jgi:hypothetical protein